MTLALGACAGKSPPPAIASAPAPAAAARPPSASCQKLVDQAMADNTVEFAKGSASIKKTSLAMLDRLAKTAASCEALRFLVEDIERKRFRRLELILRNAGGGNRLERVAGKQPCQPQASSGLQK